MHITIRQHSAITPTIDSGFLIIGTSASNDGDITDGNKGEADILILKINSEGEKVWDKTLGGGVLTTEAPQLSKIGMEVLLWLVKQL